MNNLDDVLLLLSAVKNSDPYALAIAVGCGVLWLPLRIILRGAATTFVESLERNRFWDPWTSNTNKKTKCGTVRIIRRGSPKARLKEEAKDKAA